jgi:hypothetical protein
MRINIPKNAILSHFLCEFERFCVSLSAKLDKTNSILADTNQTEEINII